LWKHERCPENIKKLALQLFLLCFPLHTRLSLPRPHLGEVVRRKTGQKGFFLAGLSNPLKGLQMRTLENTLFASLAMLEAVCFGIVFTVNRTVFWIGLGLCTALITPMVLHVVCKSRGLKTKGAWQNEQQ
jgi:hypothetical protein